MTKPNQSDELLPCAHCGGEGRLVSDFPGRDHDKENCCTAFVRCVKCLAQTDIADSCAANFNTEANAIEAWNRRVTPTQSSIKAASDEIKRLIGRLHQMCSQEGCDGEPYDEINHIADELSRHFHPTGGETQAAQPVGNFTPTMFWDEKELVLTVVLEREQFISVSIKASRPFDNSNEAIWGRKILQEIHAEYLKRLETDGSCTVKIVPRKYDGGVV